jgi:hypothetical protein
MSFILLDDDFEDQYEEIQEAPRRRTLLVFVIIAGLLSLYLIKSTFAANVNINSNQSIEFGQGYSQLVACSRSQALSISPASTATEIIERRREAITQRRMRGRSAFTCRFYLD